MSELIVPSKAELYKDLDPNTSMRILVVRKGAIGDVLMATPVLSTLAAGYGEQGTKVVVDFYGREHSNAVLANNPYVDRVYDYPMNLTGAAQEVLNEQEKILYSRYDGVIQLHMTIEGRYLWRTDGRYGIRNLKADSETALWGESPTRRKAAENVNYMDVTLQAAGLEHIGGRNPELFLGEDEKQWLMDLKQKYRDKYVVLWQIMGSTGNKAVLSAMKYLKFMIDECPESEHFIIGDKRLQRSPEIDQYPQIHFTVGNWSLRQAIIATRIADLVIGPESMLVVAASAWDPMAYDEKGKNIPSPNTFQLKKPVGKMMFFSHGIPTNISKYWKDVDNIIPGTPCSPCYLIPVTHYFQECMTEYNGGAAFKCIASLPHEDIKARLKERYDEWAKTHLKQNAK